MLWAVKHRSAVELFLGSPGAVEGKLGKNRTEADLRRYLDERERLEKEREEVRASLASLKKEKREIREELGSCQGTTASFLTRWSLADLCNDGFFCCPPDPKQQASLEARSKQKEEECREAEHRRVEVELQLMEVKENLKKAESGPFTLGTTLDSSLQESLSVSLTSGIKGTLFPRLEPMFTTPLPFQSRGAAASPASQTSPSSATPSQPVHSYSSVETAPPVSSVSVLKPRATSIMATKGKVLQRAKVRAHPGRTQMQI